MLFWTGVGISGSGIAIQMFSFMESNIAGVMAGLTMVLLGAILLWTKARGVM